MLAQTTLSHRDRSDVADAAQARFGDVWMPGRSDLCFATTNLLGAMETAVHASLAVAPEARIAAADRTTAASNVLATLAATVA